MPIYVDLAIHEISIIADKDYFSHTDIKTLSRSDEVTIHNNDGEHEFDIQKLEIPKDQTLMVSVRR